MMTNNIFKDERGNYSSSRFIGIITVLWALIAGGALVAVKYYQPEADIMAMATASGLVFTTVAGPALAFLFLQKKTEVKQELDIKKIDEAK